MGRGRRVAIISVVFLCLTIIIPFVYYVAARPYPLIIKGDYVEGNPEGQESDTDSVTGAVIPNGPVVYHMNGPKTVVKMDREAAKAGIRMYLGGPYDVPTRSSYLSTNLVNGTVTQTIEVEIHCAHNVYLLIDLPDEVKLDSQAYRLNVTNSGDRDGCNTIYYVGWLVVGVFCLTFLIVSIFTGLKAMTLSRKKKEYTMIGGMEEDEEGEEDM
ncbi:hypothetical protein PROFUN_08018 [Planoprotostelium fungivorum]|uniref:Uncharacterized protein n=1 Tax=Planoprotostelium fungivorum TaxID=1890364 RepID=A0A2P6MVB2_9EUKA|nr:hypothetical protein PROFUN_08018 [Planoprotostelium fungivorum]